MTDESNERLIREFTFFAEMCEGVAPLYAALSARVAEDAWVMGLSAPQDSGPSGLQDSSPELGNVISAKKQERNPPANMLFGAVQYLLLGGAEHPLREFYPSIVGPAGVAPPDAAWSHFVDFCRAHEGDIRRLVSTRRVQTNEAGRCAALLPGFALAAAHGDPLYLIELGPSAGLNLNFDQYRYEYSSGARCGPVNSPVVIRCKVTGEHAPPVPNSMPRVANRIGVDKSPIDVHDDDAVRWVQALIWADDIDRHATFRAAVEVARRHSPRIIEGDGLEHVPRLVSEAPADALPVVYHSSAIYQMPEFWREEFAASLDELGRERDFAHLSLEWLGDDPGPMLHLTTWHGGVPKHRFLARVHHHGRRMEWAVNSEHQI